MIQTSKALSAGNLAGEEGQLGCAVSLDKLVVRYDKFEALRGISLRLPRGAVGLVGRNGAGKSTLLKVLLGLVAPTSGTGEVMGVDLVQSGDRLRQFVGYMPENDSLLIGMKGYEQVALAGELCGLSAREAIRRAHEVLAYTQLGEARYRPIQQYSAGMRQRLKLAVALVHDPSLLLLDEPTVGLDPPGRKAMLDLIVDLISQHGKSLLISTHLLGDIEHTCTHVAMMESGEILTSGTIGEVLAKLTGDGGGIRKTIRLRWQGTPLPFLSRLESLGIIVRGKENIDESVPSHRNEVKLDLPVEIETRQIFSIARESSVIILTLEADRGDLNQLYLQLLGRKVNTNA